MFPGTPEERAAAEAAKDEVERLIAKKVVSAIRARTRFWKAEEHHQDYYKKHPDAYARYG